MLARLNRVVIDEEEEDEADREARMKKAGNRLLDLVGVTEKKIMWMSEWFS